MPVVDQRRIEARLTKRLLDKCLSTRPTGSADQERVDELIAAVDAWVREKVGSAAIAALENGSLSPAQSDSMVRIALDVARAYLAEWHPEVMRISAKDIFARCEGDAKLLRQGITNLLTPEPEEPTFNRDPSCDSEESRGW